MSSVSRRPVPHSFRRGSSRDEAWRGWSSVKEVRTASSSLGFEFIRECQYPAWWICTQSYVRHHPNADNWSVLTESTSKASIVAPGSTARSHAAWISSSKGQYQPFIADGLRDAGEHWRDLRRWSGNSEDLKIHQCPEEVRTSVHMPTEMQLIPAIPCSNTSQNSELLGVSTSKCWCSPPWHCDWWIRYWLFVNYRKPFSDPQWQLQSLGLSLPDRDGAYKSLRWAPECVGSRKSGTLPLHRCF